MHTARQRAESYCAASGVVWEEGRIEGRIQMLIEMLEDLPGDMSEALKARIQQEEDLNVLKEYVRLARKVSAIEEFEELIKDTR